MTDYDVVVWAQMSHALAGSESAESRAVAEARLTKRLQFSHARTYTLSNWTVSLYLLDFSLYAFRQELI